MTTSPECSRRMVTAEVTLSSSDWHLQARMTVPAGPTRLSDLLPLARALSDAVVGETVQAVEQIGEKISCKAGCGACCRHLVAIAEVEARRLREVVEDLPEPRRSEVRSRFAAARRRLAEAGLLRQLQQADQCTDADYQSLAEAYFAQHIACPFLEDESCSIYAERPITCREYLVTAPAEHCARPTPETIRRVKIPLPVFNAVARWQSPPSAYFLERWVPLSWPQNGPRPIWRTHRPVPVWTCCASCLTTCRAKEHPPPRLSGEADSLTPWEESTESRVPAAT